MDSSLAYLFLALACLAALWFLSPTFRAYSYRALIGPPNLRIEELPALMNGMQSFTVEKNPRKKLSSADRSIQAYNGQVSIIYHTKQGSSALLETVDIAHHGKAGMIFTLKNGKMVHFDRIGGMACDNPELSPCEKAALEQFMNGVRNCFEKL
ncbi:MAG: hypothetical protein KBE09_04720 [Candidatus Pacebacteria bacterium]|nr:hypothetical protein [Candidatus Paceibacterota bacterium]